MKSVIVLEPTAPSFETVAGYEAAAGLDSGEMFLLHQNFLHLSSYILLSVEWKFVGKQLHHVY